MLLAIIRSTKFQLLLTLTILCAGYFWVTEQGSRIAQDIISQVVRIQTNNSYTISYHKVDLSVFERKLTIDSMRLIPNLQPSGQEFSSAYQILAPKLVLDLKSISSIFLSNELSVEQIAVLNPKLNIVKGNSNTPKNITYEAGDLYQLISRYIKVFEVNKLQIEKGGIDYSNDFNDNNDFELRNLDFLVDNFLMDSTLTKDRFFFTDRIKLVLTDQAYLLNDDIHKLSFDTLIISTRSKKFEFKGFNIKPINKDNDSINLYELMIPAFTMRNVDFDKIYLENKIEIGELISQGGQFNLTLKQKPNTSEIGQNKLKIPSINQPINLGNIDLSFEKSTVIIGEDSISFSKFKVKGDSLSLDSTTQFHDLSLFLQNASVSIIEPKFISKRLILSTDSIDYSLRNKRLNISSLKFENQNSKLFLPYVEIILADTRTDALNIDCVVFNQPNLFFDDKTKKKGAEVSLPTWLNVDCIHINKGRIQYGKNTFASNIRAAFKFQDKFTLNKSLIKDEHSSYWVKTDQWQFKNNNLLIDGSSLSVDNFGDLQAKNLNIDQSNATLKIAEIILNKLALDSLVFHEKLSFDSLIIVEPVGSINAFSSKKSSLITYYYKKISVANGNFKVNLKGDKTILLSSLNFHSSNINGRYVSLVEIEEGQASGFSNHEVKFENLIFDEVDQYLQVNKIGINPLDDSLKNKIYADVSNILISNFDPIKTSSDSLLDFGSVKIDSVNLFGNWHLNPPEKQKKQEVIFGKLDLRKLNANFKLGDNQFQLNNATLTANDFHSNKDHVLVDNDITFFSGSVNIKTKTFTTFLDSVLLTSNNRSVSTKSGKIAISQDSIYFDALDLFNMTVNSQKDTISVTEIKLNNPIVKVDLSKKADAKQEISIKWILLDDVIIENGLVQLENTGIQYNDDITIDQVNFTTKNLNFNTTFSHLTYSDFALSTGGLSYTTSDSLYVFSTAKFSFKSNGDLKFSEVALTPVYNRRDFNTKIDYQKDWLSASLRDIEIKKWDFNRFINDSTISIRKIVFDNLYLETHRDKRLPEPKNNIKQLPQQYLKDLSYQLSVDSIEIANTYVSHSEYSPTGLRPGFIYFKNINGYLTNITNIEESLAANNMMTFNATGSLYKTGNFFLTTDFHLDHPKNQFDLTARLGNMDLTEMNALLENTAHISVKSGENRLNEISFKANDHYAVGLMKFYYKDLKIAVLKEKKNHEEENASFKSFFANTFIVNKKNPHFLFVRKGDIYFERNQEKSIFSYWAKSILSGVITSIGAGSNKKEIKEFNKSSKDKF